MNTPEMLLDKFIKSVKENISFNDELINSINYYYHLSFKKDNNYESINELKYQFDLDISRVTIASLIVRSDGFKIDFKYMIDDYYDKKASIEILNYLIRKDFISNSDNINMLLDDLIFTKDKKINSYKLDFANKLKHLSSFAEEIDIINDSEKVTIYPILGLTDHPYISIKIGRKKLYSVASWYSFIDAINHRIEKKYGKELAFIHDENAFDEKGQALIKAIVNSTRYISRGREFEINKKLFKSIISIYQGQLVDVVIDSNEPKKYLIRLNKIPFKFYIDRNYMISTKMDIINEDGHIFFDQYIINHKDMAIDILDGDEVINNLYLNIVNSEYPCLEDIIDEFKYDFILRYLDNFIIANEVKEDFEFKTLDIKAYFDYEKSIITLEEKVYLEDKLVKIESLNQRLAGQYKKYRSVLNTLGFVGNELKDEANILNFFSSSLETLKQFCEVYLSDSILNKTVNNFNPPNIRINYNSSMLEVFLEESRYDDEELLAILDGLRKKKKFVLYKNQIITIDNESSTRFLTNIENFHLVDKSNGNNKENVLPIYYAFKSLENSNGVSLNEQIINIFNEIKNYKSNPFKGGEIVGELRKYQLEGIKWLDVLYRHHLNGILADDMGLGKTIEIISFIKGENIEGNILIVAPKSLIFNWKYEFNKFSPNSKVISIYGTSKERKNIISKIKNNKKTIYLTSYDSLRRDEELYNDISFDTVILDEAQYIKNSRAQKTISVTNINSEHRFVLTGTPIENSILDLWSIFNFLMPGYLPSEEKFKYRFESDDNYVKEVKTYVTPFILRRSKKDVLKDLPDKYEVVMSCEMNDEQRKIYDAQKLLARQAIEMGQGAFEVLPYLMRLRQICIDPSLFISNYTGGSGKIEQLINIIEDKLSEGHRILIFSQFVMALNIVKDILEQKEIRYFTITGDTSAESRVSLANEFNTTRKYKIGLISLKAGGTGLNLVGADTVIHLDPWWNIAAEDQATDRAYRIGQERNVEVIKLICENSIEQRVVELQNIKKDLVDKIIAKDDSSITSLSIEDMKFILK